MCPLQVEYEVNLNYALKALGMSEAFDSTRANFSGIARGKSISLRLSTRPLPK
jgi:serine protease inhibitor